MKHFFFLLLWLLSYYSNAQSLISWDFSGNNGDEITVNGISTFTYITGQISRGTGISAANNTNRFNANRFTQPNLDAAIANNDYFEWTISVASGYQMTLNELKFNFERSSTAPQQWVLRSSLDNFSSDIYVNNAMPTTTAENIALNNFTNLTQTVYFRLYGFGNTSTTGSAGFEGTGNDLQIIGTVSSKTLQYQALATCDNANKNQYFIKISDLQGAGGAPYQVTIDGQTKIYSDTDLIFGTFSHSGIGGALKTLTITDAAGTTTTDFVSEALCGYLQNTAYCDCDALNANATNRGTIMAQAQPGSFIVSPNVTQVYVLVDENETIIAVNKMGLFTNLPTGNYKVYAINYDNADMALITTHLTVGNDFTPFNTGFSGNGTLGSACFALCGAAYYAVKCSSFSGTMGCPGRVNLSLNEDCLHILKPEMFVQNLGGCLEHFTINAFDYKQNLGNIITGEQAGKVLTYKVLQTPKGNTCWGEIRVEDKKPPEILCRDVTVSCRLSAFNARQIYTNDANELSATSIQYALNDNCDNVLKVSYTERIEDSNCDMTGFSAKIYRTYMATDFSGNTATCHQTIFLERKDLSDVTFPTDRFIECDEVFKKDGNGNPLPSETGYPRMSGTNIDADGAGYCEIKATYQDQIFETCNNTKKILRKWTILDCCQNTTRTATQSINIMDSNPPVFLENLADTLKISVTNNCFLNNYSFKKIVVADNCDLNPTLYIQIQDANNNIISLDSLTTTHLAIGIYKLHYVAMDQCGNQSQQSQYLIVEDKSPPTTICHSTLKMMITDYNNKISASNFDNGSYDNCCTQKPDIQAKRMDKPDDEFQNFITFSPDDTNVKVLLRTMDCHSNVNFCMTEALINESRLVNGEQTNINATLSGFVETENGEGIENVNIEILPVTKNEIRTDVDGFFSVKLGTNQSYAIRATKPDNMLNGVSAFDLLLIMRHLIGIQPFTSLSKFVAADIDGSGQVSMADVVALRRLLLKQIDTLPNVKVWRFLPKEKFYSNLFVKSSNIIKEDTVMTIKNNVNLNFVGIKIGDVNNSVIPNGYNNNIVARDKPKTMILNVQDIIFEAGQTLQIPFTLAEANDFSGCQFALHYNENTLELMDIKPNTASFAISPDNFGTPRKGTLTAVLSTPSNHEDYSFFPNQPNILFTMIFQAKTQGSLSDVLELANDVIPSEAYTTALEVMDVRLDFNHSMRRYYFELFQNSPNPVQTETKITFTLPEFDYAEINVYDVSGNRVKRISGTFKRGLNEIILKRQDLPKKGIYYYQLETSEHTAIKKMVVLD